MDMLVPMAAVRLSEHGNASHVFTGVDPSRRGARRGINACCRMTVTPVDPADRLKTAWRAAGSSVPPQIVCGEPTPRAGLPEKPERSFRSREGATRIHP